MSFAVHAVLDLKGGLVVRGVGGERASYRPVESAIARSPEPLAVARAFRERLGIRRLYVADLDAIGGAAPAGAVLKGLACDGFRLLVDAGIRSGAEAAALLDLGIEDVVAPLETLPGPEALEEVIAAHGPERVVFSLDQKGGRLLGDPAGWPHAGALEVALAARRCGARRILLLDLARVGSRAGPGRLDEIRSFVREMPDVEFLAGGGVRSNEDLEALRAAGARGALVASAFHDGAITRIPGAPDESRPRN